MTNLMARPNGRGVKKLFSILALSSIALLTSCGQGQDLLGTVAYNNGTFPQLGRISTSVPTLSGQYTAANPYWGINSFFSYGGGNYLAPAAGVVTSVGIGQIGNIQTNFITIAHSGRFATRIYNVSVVNVRVGDYVGKEQVIGSFFNSVTAYFQVLVDGESKCPLSFLDDAYRAQIAGANGGFTPCL
ncbi:MAG: peptidoglycan DD-metalloendopeptidase family protein [Bdellovibrionales bacterium]|nr:peptidoglycan DD-metalloendopeptidase family protein [Bdellovibrionales bacterium]